jgi:hypothetical protein
MGAMDFLDRIAERRIAESIATGELDGLPGAGRPLELDDDRMVPPELRAAYRLMKNAGYLPPEAELYAELGSAERLLAQAVSRAEHEKAASRLRLLLLRLGSNRASSLQAQAQYFDQLIERVEATGSSPGKIGKSCQGASAVD